jgi:hypothetical protein
VFYKTTKFQIPLQTVSSFDYQVFEIKMATSDDEAEVARLADLVRMMDGITFELDYKQIGSAAKLYRDDAVMKLFKVIAGKDGDIAEVLDRWYNRSHYFKEFRKARDEKKKGLLQKDLF